MSQESPPRTHDNRSLRDRIIRIFSSSPSSRLSGSNGDRLERPDDGDDSGLGRHMRDERTRLLASDQESSLGGQRNSGHGTFSPRPEHMEAGLPGSGFRSGSQTPRVLASGFRTPTLDGLSVTNRLATEIGVKNRSTMYVGCLDAVRTRSLTIFVTGIYPTTFHSSIGSGSTGGHLFEGTLLEL